ncbi:hypothetical protein ACTQXY_05170 [Faecalimonas sp. LCP19S3_D12]
MNRLTQTDDIGNWSLEGLPWKDTYVGQVITKNTSEKIYAALCKLKDYEDTVLTPNQVQELKERDTAKKPIKTKGLKNFHGNIYKVVGECSNCGCGVNSFMMFCDYCGQRLKWEE